MKLILDKVASSTKNAHISKVVRVASHVVAQEGFVVAARVVSRKSVYNTLEDLHGRMMQLHEGDLIAGVLGHRRALRGYSGEVPGEIKVGDKLSLLNLGGVIGRCTSSNVELGAPLSVEILGSVLAFSSMDERVGIPAHVLKGEVENAEDIGGLEAPLVFVSGSCMNSGKTTACAELIRHFSRQGLRVVAAKVTGVSLLRDTLAMQDHGAIKAYSFMDAGIVTTSAESLLPGVRGILKSFQKWKPDVCVVELGDGIFGEYGVREILEDEEIKTLRQVHVACASDPVGAWGMAKTFNDVFGRSVSVFCGPVTDNAVGTHYIEKQLGLPAFNARIQGEELAKCVLEVCQQKMKGVSTRVA